MKGEKKAAEIEFKGLDPYRKTSPVFRLAVRHVLKVLAKKAKKTKNRYDDYIVKLLYFIFG